MLLKKQRNDLFNIIIDLGINPMDFTEKNDSIKYELRVKDTSFSFSITETNASSPIGDAYSKVAYIPRIGMREVDERVGVTWKENMPYFKKWADMLKEELYAPDLWAEAQSNSKLFALDSTAPNEMFNSSELRQLEGQVRLLSQQITALGLPAHAQKMLTGIVEEIPQKATRLTKEEVRGWFMSAIVTQVTTLALSPEHVAAIGHLLKTTFMGILQLH